MVIPFGAVQKAALNERSDSVLKVLSLFSGIGAFEKAEKVNSNTQLYKQVGNSIVVDVLDEDGNFFV